MGLRVELFARIRRDARIAELSIWELAPRHGVAWATVRQALAQAELPARKVPARVAPRLDRFKTAIDAMLVEDVAAPREQRYARAPDVCIRRTIRFRPTWPFLLPAIYLLSHISPSKQLRKPCR